MANQNDIVRRATQPVADLMVVSAETTGTMILRQNAVMSELVEAGVETLRKSLTAGSMQDAFEAQRDYVSIVSDKLQGLQRENLETLRNAGGNARDVVRNAFNTEQSEEAAA